MKNTWLDILSLKHRLHRSGFADLSSNVPDTGAPYARYPDPRLEELTRKYGSFLGGNCHGEILFTRGITEGIDLIVRCFLADGKGVVAIPGPVFPLYEYFSELRNASVQRLGLSVDPARGTLWFPLPRERADVLFLCNPHNPYGRVFSTAFLGSVLDRFPGIVVIDEAYIEYSDEPSVVPLLRFYPRLVVLRTFSKAWGLAGARCGAVLASSALIAPLRNAQGPFGFPVPVCETVTRALDEPAGMFGHVDAVRVERARLFEALASSPGVRRVHPSEANFVLAEVDEPKAFCDHLFHHRILVEDSSRLVPGSVRISVGSRESNDRVIDLCRNHSRQTIALAS